MDRKAANGRRSSGRIATWLALVIAATLALPGVSQASNIGSRPVYTNVMGSGQVVESLYASSYAGQQVEFVNPAIRYTCGDANQASTLDNSVSRSFALVNCSPYYMGIGATRTPGFSCPPAADGTTPAPECDLVGHADARTPASGEIGGTESNDHDRWFKFVGWTDNSVCSGQTAACRFTVAHCINGGADCAYLPPVQITALITDNHAPTAFIDDKPPTVSTDPAGTATFTFHSDEYL